MDVMIAIVCAAVVAAFATWALMDHRYDERWNREHGIVDDPEDDLIRRAVAGELFEDQDEHLVTLRVLWTGDASLGVEIIDDHIDQLMTDLLARRSITDPSIEQTSHVRRP